MRIPTNDIFWTYLFPILEMERLNGIKYIQMSDSNGMDRFLSDSRSEDIYPGIYVLRPKYSGQMVENALMLAQFDTTLFVFFQGDQDNYESEDDAYNQAESIVGSVIKSLQHDRFISKNYLDFDSVKVEPVMYSTGLDSTYGYELKMRLGLPANQIFC